jgi:granule-bound starch synthase
VQHKYQANGEFTKAKCVYCIHNIAFQGRFWPETLEDLQVPPAAMEAFEFTDGYKKVYSEKTPKKEEDDIEKDMGGEHAKVNWMKAGFLTSDKNLTVSPNYATEIASSPEGGVELDKVIRSTGIEGIVNGTHQSQPGQLLSPQLHSVAPSMRCTTPRAVAS